MLISVPELIFWIMSISGNKTGHWLFNMWASYMGLYGSIIMYAFAMLWPIIQLSSYSTVSGISDSSDVN